jgi:hypothetical protein
MKIIRLLTLAAGLVASLQLTGCANISMSQPKAALETTAALRGTAMAPAAIGKFSLDSSLPANVDQSISLRGANSVKSPIDGSFSQYLRESLRVELEAAGLFDAASKTVVNGTLTRSEADAAIGTGTAKLGARFVVTRADSVKYDKEWVVDDSWESSFVGATAIPLAAAHYEGLYRKLTGKLLADPQFRAALAKE